MTLEHQCKMLSQTSVKAGGIVRLASSIHESLFGAYVQSENVKASDGSVEPRAPDGLSGNIGESIESLNAHLNYLNDLIASLNDNIHGKVVPGQIGDGGSSVQFHSSPWTGEIGEGSAQ